MINFEIEKSSDKLYDITFMKLVHKRSGEYVEEPGEKLYSMPLDKIKAEIAFRELSTRDDDYTLKQFLLEYLKCYDEVCELLKKTL